MAKISMEYDTEDKSLVCSIDGTEVPHVTGANVGRSYDGETYYCDIHTRMKDEATGITYLSMLMASESDSVKTREVIDAAFAGFVETPPQIEAASRSVAKILARFRQ